MKTSKVFIEMQIASFVIGCLVLTIAATTKVPKVEVQYICRQENVIQNEYIIVLKPGIDVQSHLVSFRQSLPNQITLLGTFSIGEFKGYGTEINNGVLNILKTRTDVSYIECNRIGPSAYMAAVSPKVQEHGDVNGQVACAHQGNPVSWGLVRTTTPDGNGVTYDYATNTNGQGVHVYIIDSGIDVTHPNFGAPSRASWGVDLVYLSTQPNYQRDVFGHGTHVAGTVLSSTYGVAKQAKAIAISIFNDRGDMTSLRAIMGLNFAVNDDAQKRRVESSTRRRSIINLSIGMVRSDSVNKAISAAIKEGFVVVASAGNEEKDACGYSPGGVQSAITVMASDNKNQSADFSNFGSCADIFAPGVDILSTIPNGGYEVKSGTSMAAPHVSGVIAKYLSRFPTNNQPTPEEVKNWLLNNAKPDMVQHNKPLTTRKLVYYKDCT